MTATPVRYRGLKYRNALDAKWAAFFHHNDWDVVYDPFGEGGTTFLVQQFPDPFFVLVTPATSGADYIDCLEAYRQEHGDETRPLAHPLYVVGLSPLPRFGNAESEPRSKRVPFAGIIDGGRLGKHVSSMWLIDEPITGPREVLTLVDYGTHWQGKTDPTIRPWVVEAWAKATNDLQGVAR